MWLLRGHRAVAAAINAEIRSGKEVVGMELGQLEKLAYRKVKGVPESELDTRRQMVEQLWEKLRTISDAARFPRPRKTAVQPFNVSLDIAEAGGEAHYASQAGTSCWHLI